MFSLVHPGTSRGWEARYKKWRVILIFNQSNACHITTKSESEMSGRQSVKVKRVWCVFE